MAKFTIVKEAPKDLPKDTYVIKAPEFTEEIRALMGQAPANGMLTSSFIHYIFDRIGHKYVSKSFNSQALVNPTNFIGHAFSNVDDINNTILKMLKVKENKHFVDSYVDFHIKQRPYNTKLIYFLGDFLESGAFTKNGIDEIHAQDIAAYLGDTSLNKGVRNKPKTKPAIKAVENKKQEPVEEKPAPVKKPVKSSTRKETKPADDIQNLLDDL